MKSLKSTIKPLKLKQSKSFRKSIISYFAYKSKSLQDIEHAMYVVDKINSVVNRILIEQKHYSQKVQFGSSKNLQRFIIEKHTIFFRIDLKKRELKLMYFVPSTRIKKSL